MLWSILRCCLLSVLLKRRQSALEKLGRRLKEHLAAQRGSYTFCSASDTQASGRLQKGTNQSAPAHVASALVHFLVASFRTPALCWVLFGLPEKACGPADRLRDLEFRHDAMLS